MTKEGIEMSSSRLSRSNGLKLSSWNQNGSGFLMSADFHSRISFLIFTLLQFWWLQFIFCAKILFCFVLTWNEKVSFLLLTPQSRLLMYFSLIWNLHSSSAIKISSCWLVQFVNTIPSNWRQLIKSLDSGWQTIFWSLKGITNRSDTSRSWRTKSEIKKRFF